MSFDAGSSLDAWLDSLPEADVIARVERMKSNYGDLAQMSNQQLSDWAIKNAINEDRWFAKGGYASPGMAIVGEQGPELIDLKTPARVYTASQTRSMMGGSDELIAEVRALRQEVINLRAEAGATARHTAKTNRTLERVIPDGDAIATRVAA
jgi:hypothetical protein